MDQNEKRKWQIALRRYVFMENKARAYAPYFGIDASGFRSWIEMQFEDGQTWDTFSINWQLGHVLPVGCFSFEDDNDLRLCWNFINICVDPVQTMNKPDFLKIDSLLYAKTYFSQLYQLSNNAICEQLLCKIEEIEQRVHSFVIKDVHQQALGGFLKDEKEYLSFLLEMDENQFLQLNQGVSVEELKAEQMLLRRFAND